MQLNISKNKLKINKTLFTWFILLLVLLSSFFYIKNRFDHLMHSLEIIKNQETIILTKLSDVESEKRIISDNQSQLTYLKNDVADLAKNMLNKQALSNMATTQDLQLIAAQINQLKKELPVIKSNNNSLNHPAVAHSSFPFKVLSIDKISGYTFASVVYHQNPLPILLNDSLAGWKLVQIDVVNGKSVWRNLKGRQVVLSRQVNG